MTKPTNTSSAGPARSVISPRLRQSGRRGARVGTDDSSVPTRLLLAGAVDAISACDSVMLLLSAPCRGVRDAVNELLRVALTREHLNNAGVQRVSDVLAECGVQPQRHVRSLAVRLHQRLQRRVSDRASSILVRGNRLVRHGVLFLPFLR